MITADMHVGLFLASFKPSMPVHSTQSEDQVKIRNVQYSMSITCEARPIFGHDWSA
jgi:hypothetical protein